MIALGSHAHIFAQPQRREPLRWCSEAVLGCPVAEVDHPGMAEPMLVARFPGGGILSIEFIPEAPDDERPRLGAWLELRAEDPAAVMRTVLEGAARGEASWSPVLLHGSRRAGVHDRPVG